MPGIENQSVKIFLKKGRTKSVINRHPWIYSGAVEQVEGDARPGEVVRVYAHERQFLAKGFFNPHSQIRVRLLSFEDQTVDASFFRNRIELAYRLRTSLLSGDISAYRIINSDGDGLSGLIVDRYGDILVTQFSSFGMVILKPIITETLRELFKPPAIIERSESKALAEEGLKPAKGLLYGTLPQEVHIQEYNCRYKVDVLEGQKTGFFLDQRENRHLIGRLAAGKRLLNCFAYTGGFSLSAALNGADTTSMDISRSSLELAKQNFILNGLNPEEHRFINIDVFTFLRQLQESYDVIVLDPPPFVKSQKDLNRGARGYKDINRLAIRQIRDNGLLLTCSCSALVNWDLFQKIVFSAAREADRNVQIIARLSQPLDHPVNIFHPEGEYLKSFLLRVYDS